MVSPSEGPRWDRQGRLIQRTEQQDAKPVDDARQVDETTSSGDTEATSGESSDTTADQTQENTYDPQEAARARERFVHESGESYRAYQLQKQLELVDYSTDTESDVPNVSPVGGLGSALRTFSEPPPGVPTVGDLHSAIQGFSKDPNIPFSYAQDGCYARADVMSRALEARGIPAQKVWAFPEGGMLRVPEAQWQYHVATEARAWNPQTGRVGSYVIDPSISGRPMTTQGWVGKMNPEGLPVRTTVTPNSAYIPDPSNPGKGFYDVDGARQWGMEPETTFRNYSGARAAQGLPANAGPPDGIPTNAEVAASRTGAVAKISSAASRGLGGLAVVGGGLQVANGVNEWNNGNRVDGAVDVVSGGLNAAGGAAMATGVGTVAAPFLFGASSVIDGGNDLVHGISEGDARKTGVGAAKTIGGGAMIAGGALVATGVGAPVGAALIAGGAIVSAGAAIYDSYHEEIDSAVSTAVDAVGTAVDNVGDALKSGWDTVTSWF